MQLQGTEGTVAGIQLGCVYQPKRTPVRYPDNPSVGLPERTEFGVEVHINRRPETACNLSPDCRQCWLPAQGLPGGKFSLLFHGAFRGKRAEGTGKAGLADHQRHAGFSAWRIIRGPALSRVIPGKNGG